MLDGLAYLVTEIAALLVVSALLGLLAGHFLWPHRPRRDAPTGGTRGARDPHVDGVYGVTPPGAFTPANSSATWGPDRTPTPPSLPALPPATPAGTQPRPPVTPPGGAVPTDGPDPVVAELERRLRSSRAEVVTLQAEALRLKAAVSAVADSKDAEMGRLESAAIEALDSLIASHQQRMTALEEETAASAAAGRRHERDLEEERRRTLRLQAALTDRDERIAALTNDLADRDRRLAESRDQAQPSSQETGSGSPNR